MDFHLWETVIEKVYETQINTHQELVQRITIYYIYYIYLLYSYINSHLFTQLRTVSFPFSNKKLVTQ